MSRYQAALAAFFVLTLAALLTPAGALAASPSPSPGSAVITYKIGMNQDCDGMNPFSSWSGISWECFRLGYDFLTWYDKDYKPTPDVASSWETSSDGKTWTFHVRQGMTWQDGRPLTANDVAFTYNLIIKTQDASYIQYLTGVTRVTASWGRSTRGATFAASSSSRCSAIAGGSTNGSQRVAAASSTWRARGLRSSSGAILWACPAMSSTLCADSSSAAPPR